ncbi:MAG: hypothetical protein KBD63_03815 [Bacteriovoracaceae bacterium]|nr:hypothetical protein [Bacteriovoracaceae bacterium]
MKISQIKILFYFLFTFFILGGPKLFAQDLTSGSSGWGNKIRGPLGTNTENSFDTPDGINYKQNVEISFSADVQKVICSTGGNYLYKVANNASYKFKDPSQIQALFEESRVKKLFTLKEGKTLIEKTQEKSPLNTALLLLGVAPNQMKDVANFFRAREITHKDDLSNPEILDLGRWFTPQDENDYLEKRLPSARAKLKRAYFLNLEEKLEKFDSKQAQDLKNNRAYLLKGEPIPQDPLLKNKLDDYILYASSFLDEFYNLKSQKTSESLDKYGQTELRYREDNGTCHAYTGEIFLPWASEISQSLRESVFPVITERENQGYLLMCENGEILPANIFMDLFAYLNRCFSDPKTIVGKKLAREPFTTLREQVPLMSDIVLTHSANSPFDNYFYDFKQKTLRDPTKAPSNNQEQDTFLNRMEAVYIHAKRLKGEPLNGMNFCQDYQPKAQNIVNGKSRVLGNLAFGKGVWNHSIDHASIETVEGVDILTGKKGENAGSINNLSQVVKVYYESAIKLEKAQNIEQAKKILIEKKEVAYKLFMEVLTKPSTINILCQNPLSPQEACAEISNTDIVLAKMPEPQDQSHKRKCLGYGQTITLTDKVTGAKTSSTFNPEDIGVFGFSEPSAKSLYSGCEINPSDVLNAGLVREKAIQELIKFYYENPQHRESLKGYTFNMRNIDLSYTAPRTYKDEKGEAIPVQEALLGAHAKNKPTQGLILVAPNKKEISCSWYNEWERVPLEGKTREYKFDWQTPFEVPRLVYRAGEGQIAQLNEITKSDLNKCVDKKSASSSFDPTDPTLGLQMATIMSKECYSSKNFLEDVVELVLCKAVSQTGNKADLEYYDERMQEFTSKYQDKVDMDQVHTFIDESVGIEVEEFKL